MLEGEERRETVSIPFTNIYDFIDSLPGPPSIIADFWVGAAVWLAALCFNGIGGNLYN